MFRQIGPAEIMIILGVVVLLFGGRKLPEVARGSGRALRIFKSEIKGLQDDEADDQTAEGTAELSHDSVHGDGVHGDGAHEDSQRTTQDGHSEQASQSPIASQNRKPDRG